MKTKEELNAIKNEVEAVGRKLAELTEDELQQIAGGTVTLQNMPPKQGNEKYVMSFTPSTNDTIFNFHIYTGSVTDDFEPDFGN